MFGTMSSISALALGAAAAASAAGGGAPSLLALDRRVAIGGNSWEAIGNTDYVTLAWAYAGCRGVPSIGMRQARGGDRLSHLVDRVAPLASVRPGLAILMNPINDFADSAVTDNNAGGDVALARLDSVVSSIRAQTSDCIILAGDAVNAAGILAKPTARARYKAGIASRAGADSKFVGFDPNATGVVAGVDLTSSADSADATHIYKTASTVRTAKNMGAVWASKFVADDIFAAGLSLTNNIVAFNPASSWTVTTNSSGLTAAQSADTLRQRSSVACRKFSITGTSTLDPTISGTTPDLQLRITLPISAGFSTDGKTFAAIMLLEITSASGGAPVGLATIQINDGFNQAFNKQLVAAEGGYLWDEGWAGPIGIVPSAQATGQTANITFDLRLRAKQNVATDIEIRIAAINIINTEATAYGPPACMSKAFTIGDGTNRTVLRAIPTTSPTSTVATGGTIAKNTSGFFVGGGLANQFDAMRAGVTDVGDLSPALAGQAAVPYTTVGGDTGQGIAMRHTATNAFGSDSISSNLVSVT